MENKKFMKKLKKDYDYTSSLYSENQIVGIFLQGNQNYGVSSYSPYICSLCILAPSFEDLCFNKEAASNTSYYVDCITKKLNHRIVFKDIRQVFLHFKRKNFNLAKILFTEYKIINPLYEEIWNRLIQDIEMVAQYNSYRVISDAACIASEKYYTLENKHFSKVEVTNKFGGYNPEQLCDLIKMHDFIYKYSHGSSYSESLKLEPEKIDYLRSIKKHGVEGGLEEARKLAKKYFDEIREISDEFQKNCENKENHEAVNKLLDNIQRETIKKHLKLELENDFISIL